MKFSYGIVGGLGKGQGRTLRMPWKWFFFLLSCHLLWENTGLCLQEAEIRPRLVKETVPQPSQPWKSCLSHMWMKTRSSRAAITEGWAQLASNPSPCQANTLWRSVFSSDSFSSSWSSFFSPLGPRGPSLPHHTLLCWGLCSRDLAGSTWAPSPVEDSSLHSRLVVLKETIWPSLEALLTVQPAGRGCELLAPSG